LFADPMTAYQVAPTAGTLAAAFTGAGVVSTVFVATGRTATQSTYRRTVSATNWYDLTIGRQVGKRNRYTVRFTESEIVPDAMDPTLNSLKTATIYVVADIGPLGTTTGWAKLNHMLSYFIYDPIDSTPPMDRVIGGET
jgi:hypothetical protein